MNTEENKQNIGVNEGAKQQQKNFLKIKKSAEAKKNQAKFNPKSHQKSSVPRSDGNSDNTRVQIVKPEGSTEVKRGILAGFKAKSDQKKSEIKNASNQHFSNDAHGSSMKPQKNASKGQNVKSSGAADEQSKPHSRYPNSPKRQQQNRGPDDKTPSKQRTTSRRDVPKKAQEKEFSFGNPNIVIRQITPQEKAENAILKSTLFDFNEEFDYVIRDHEFLDSYKYDW